MKSAKKILALILAGVMALALLTGCGKAASLDRTVAEGLAECFKSKFAEEGLSNNISVSYQVPELSRNIAPLFDENWIAYDVDGNPNALDRNHQINGKTIEETLKNILSPHISAASTVFFVAADVTDVKTPFMEITNLNNSQIALIITGSPFEPASVTTIKIAVTHKTVKGRTYALAVVIAE
jgi:hypothetical protein